MITDSRQLFRSLVAVGKKHFFCPEVLYFTLLLSFVDSVVDTLQQKQWSPSDLLSGLHSSLQEFAVPAIVLPYHR